MLHKEELLAKIKEIRLLKTHLEMLQKPVYSLLYKLFCSKKKDRIDTEKEQLELSYKIINLKLEILQALIKDKQFFFMDVDYDLLEKWIS